VGLVQNTSNALIDRFSAQVGFNSAARLTCNQTSQALQSIVFANPQWTDVRLGNKCGNYN
jgi:hypothetical protein